MDLKENISYMFLHRLVSAVLIPGEDCRFVPSFWIYPCCPTLAAVHLCVVFAGTWHTEANAALATYILPLNSSKTLGSSLKPATPPTFLITVSSVP